MSHQNRTVFVNMDQRRRLLRENRFKVVVFTDAVRSSSDLVQAALAETDPVFDGDDGHAPLLPPVLPVKLVHSGAAVVVVRFALAVVPAAPRVLRVELEFAD